MSKADGNINIDTNINDKGIDTGLKRAASKLNNFVKKAKELGGLGSLMTGIGVAVAGVSKALSIAVKNVSEMTEAYRTQIKVEKQLDQAVKNSPLMNGAASQRMKDYASELQKVSTYGDEQLIPLFSQLVNSGRTEAETMDIMTTAVDIASSGMMSLDQAVSSLNMTFQGTSGSLGRQISSIKNLTAEELKSGKAIEILKNQFKGTAEEVAKTMGTSDQLKNSIGDLKEEMGAGWEKSLAPARKWLQNLIDKQTDILKQKRLIDEAYKDIQDGEAESTKWEKAIEGKIQEITEAGKKLKEVQSKDYEQRLRAGLKRGGYSDDYATKQLEENRKNAQDYYDKLNEELVEYKKNLKEQKDLEAQVYIANQDKLKAQEEEKANLDAILKTQENYNKIIAKRNETIARLEAEAKAMGEEVSLQDILNAELQAYIEMSLDPSLTDQAKTQLNIVTDLVRQTEALAEAEAKREEGNGKKSAFKDALSEITIPQKKSEILKEQLDILDELNKAFVESSIFEETGIEEKERLYSEYTQKRKQLEKEITEAVKEESEKQTTTVEDMLSTISDFTGKIASAMNNISDMAEQNATNRATTENAKLEEEYKNGLISFEEYEKKKDEIQKESDRKTYQAQMWKWSSNLAEIGVSTAQAIANALTMTPAPLGIAMASVVAGLGATQLANAIASKPIAPHYAQGGIVGGGAYSNGDNINANIKTGEMILSKQNQLNLWRMAQGGGRSASGNNIQIKNYRGNDTTVTPQITEEGIKILIRKSVAEDLQNRKFNGALLSAENTMNGIHYES